MLDFIIQMVGTRPIEIIAVICGLINVFLIIRRSIWNYPFGFVMVVLYAKIFFDYQLYSDSLLQIYFFFIQIYGLWHWLQRRDGDGKVIARFLERQYYLRYGLITLSGWLVLSFVMDRFTDASLPYWDGAVAVLSVVAQFLMSRRYVQSWYLWITVDVLAIGLFYVKDLAPTSALYAVFLALAVVGLFTWLKAAKTQHKV